MKKVLFALFTGVFLSLAVNAQTFQPYANAGVALSSDVVSYTGQVGGKSDNSRYAATVSSVTRDVENLWKLGAIGYWKVNKSAQVDIFATGGADFALTSKHPITITPGVATVFNFRGAFKPEFNLGFPIGENERFRNRALGIIGGISLNYTF